MSTIEELLEAIQRNEITNPRVAVVRTLEAVIERLKARTKVYANSDHEFDETIVWDCSTIRVCLEDELKAAKESR